MLLIDLFVCLLSARLKHRACRSDTSCGLQGTTEISNTPPVLWTMKSNLQLIVLMECFLQG